MEQLHLAKETDKFPFFKDGDVRITISGSRQYQLHSDVLRAISQRFANILSEHVSTRPSKKGTTVRYRVVAVDNPNETRWPSKDLVPLLLEQIALDGDGKPSHSIPVVGLDLENGRRPRAIHVAYDNVLGAIYNRAMDLGDWQNDGLDVILSKAVDIVNVAEYLGVENVITHSIEATLLATGQNLYSAIANNPPAWLDFAFRIKSRAIFHEALIHATGQYNTPEMQRVIKEDMVKEVAEVVVRKGEKLKKDVANTFSRMFAYYYPSSLLRSQTVNRADKDNFGRASYANDIFKWMALMIFRQFGIINLCLDRTHHGEDLGFAIMSKMHQGGETYLNRTELTEFQRGFPLSSKGVNVVENHLIELKETVRTKFVSAYFTSTCHLDINTHSVNHFTCTRVNYEDYPWGQSFSRQTADAEVSRDNNNGNLPRESSDDEMEF